MNTAWFVLRTTLSGSSGWWASASAPSLAYTLSTLRSTMESFNSHKPNRKERLELIQYYREMEEELHRLIREKQLLEKTE